MGTLQEYRRFFAEFVVASSGSKDERLINAFAAVPREDYVGPGPWPVFVGSRYLHTVDADPRSIYQDVLVGLAVERKINNGQPSLHAHCIAAAGLKPGEFVTHVGAGTGYYSAVLATLVGPTGRVVALEVEADLAAKATENLRTFRHVQVQAANATNVPLPASDLIYVNAGATHPPPAWLDALNVGGRLIMPLTPNDGFGVMLKVTRAHASAYAATAICRVAFIPCVGARDDATSASLSSALRRQSLEEVRSLHRGTAPDATAWCVGHGWWLSSSPLAAL